MARPSLCPLAYDAGLVVVAELVLLELVESDECEASLLRLKKPVNLFQKPRCCLDGSELFDPLEGVVAALPLFEAATPLWLELLLFAVEAAAALSLLCAALG
jgi:hypothetical protein